MQNIHRFYVAFTALALNACALQNTASEAGNDVKSNVQHASEKVTELFTPLPPRVNKVVPERYCYSVLQDIICYSHALPGADERLVAYQGNVVVPDRPKPLPPEGEVGWDSRNNVQPLIKTAATPPSYPPIATQSVMLKPLSPVEVDAVPVASAP